MYHICKILVYMCWYGYNFLMVLLNFAEKRKDISIGITSAGIIVNLQANRGIIMNHRLFISIWERNWFECYEQGLPVS